MRMLAAAVLFAPVLQPQPEASTIKSDERVILFRRSRPGPTMAAGPPRSAAGSSSQSMIPHGERS